MVSGKSGLSAWVTNVDFPHYGEHPDAALRGLLEAPGNAVTKVALLTWVGDQGAALSGVAV